MQLYDRHIFIPFLYLCYRTMIASAPLLAFAHNRAEGELRDYYHKHYEEEEGHDEMLRDDLRRFGVEEIPSSYAAAMIAGSQYYFIAHEHPAMLLGYMHALEKESLDVSVVDDLSRHYGVELTALRHHALHDPTHRRDLTAMIQGLPTTLQERVQWNEQCVTESYQQYMNMLEHSHA